MRHARKVDANQQEIVSALRKAGASVEILSDVGRGVPDLLVGHHFRNWLLEIKVEKETLTPEQRKWHHNWNGFPPTVVRTSEEALVAIGATETKAPPDTTPSRVKRGAARRGEIGESHEPDR